MVLVLLCDNMRFELYREIEFCVVIKFALKLVEKNVLCCVVSCWGVFHITTQHNVPCLAEISVKGFPAHVSNKRSSST